MTNDQYGTYQTPSSRPPEPPYRADAQNEPEVRGYERPADVYPAQTYPQENIQPTESFAEARGGDTASMPYGSAAAPTQADHAAATANRYQAATQYQPGAQRQTASAGQPPRHESAPAPAPAQRSGGAGKTFLFGFLGALVACALALGGFALWTNANGASTSASAVLGTSDSSVIDAVEEGQTLAEAVAAKALPSVVAVYNYQQASTTSSYGYGSGAPAATGTGNLQASGMGSGVLISDEGYILTNYHVVEDADKLTVKVGDEERDATFVGGDDSSDVAVIKIEDTSNLTVADIGDSDDLVIGEWVMTIGAPLGLEQSVATGVVSATNRSTIMNDSSSSDLYSYLYGTTSNDYTYYPNMIQTDAVINPGNSGGALVDADGKLIGINTMISSYSGDYAGVGFAIPINYAIGIAEQVIDGKEPTHAMLGVSISSVTASNAQRYGLSSSTGAYIAAISEGTGAADSDLQVGDIITAIDGKQVTSTTDVTLDVRAHNPGDTVTVTVDRNGETLDIPVVLSSDESLQTSSGNTGSGGSSSQDGQNSQNGSGSSGYDERQLEELLKMFGF